MQSNNKRVLVGVIVTLIAIAVLIAAFMWGRSTSSDDRSETTAATTPTATGSRSAAQTTAATTSAAADTALTPPAPGPPAHGLYNTVGTAAAHVESQEGGMSVIDPGTTWQPDAVLHVIRATPEGSASYGGDFYYFFVNGYQVGMENFTSAQSQAVVDGTTFAVTFNVFLPADPHCCPSGGLSTVQFHWDGGSLVTIGSMTGATM